MKRFVLTIMVMLFVSAPANGATLADINPDDNMSISGDPVFYPIDNETTVSEIIAENHTALYAYEDRAGFAIGNELGGAFDLRVAPQTEGRSELDSPLWTLVFNVQNQSAHYWSGFHFEFYTSDFENALNLRIITGETSDFGINSFNGFGMYDQLHFWSDEDLIAPGESASFRLWIDFSSWASQDLQNGFGLRQVATVATAVPVPGSVWVMGLGLIGVWWIRKKK